MDLRTLRAFVEVVRQGGFSQAAKTVFATQSTVSKAVKQLEDEIGAPLLERMGHRTRLTDLGEIVYSRAVRMLADRSDLLAELDELRGLKRGALRLGLPPVASSIIFAPLLARYRSLHPGIDVRLTEHGGDELMRLVRSGELDLAATLIPQADDLAWQDVRREPLVAVIAATIRSRLQARPILLLSRTTRLSCLPKGSRSTGSSRTRAAGGASSPWWLREAARPIF